MLFLSPNYPCITHGCWCGAVGLGMFHWEKWLNAYYYLPFSVKSGILFYVISVDLWQTQWYQFHGDIYLMPDDFFLHNNNQLFLPFGLNGKTALIWYLRSTACVQWIHVDHVISKKQDTHGNREKGKYSVGAAPKHGGTNHVWTQDPPADKLQPLPKCRWW